MPLINSFLLGGETRSLKTNAITCGVRLRTNNIHFLSHQEANGSFLCICVYVKVSNPTSTLSVFWTACSDQACFWTNCCLFSAPWFPQPSKQEAETVWIHEDIQTLLFKVDWNCVSYLLSLLDLPQATHTHSRGTNHAGWGGKLRRDPAEGIFNQWIFLQV